MLPGSRGGVSRSPKGQGPSAAVIRCTADPAKADKRTRSKWSRLMRHAATYKPDSEPLDKFIQRKGGINECAARFSRLVGEGPVHGILDCARTPFGVMLLRNLVRSLSDT
jgi:hypothetical protein